MKILLSSPFQRNIFLVFAFISCVMAKPTTSPQNFMNPFGGNFMNPFMASNFFNPFFMNPFMNSESSKRLGAMMQIFNSPEAKKIRPILEDSLPRLVEVAQTSLPELVKLTEASGSLLKEVSGATIPRIQDYTADLKEYNKEGGEFPQLLKGLRALAGN